MTDIQSRYGRRWMRPNAHLYVRPDAYRFMPPVAPRYVGRDVVKYFWPDAPASRPNKPWERKFDPGQPRVPVGNPDGGQWTSAANTESAVTPTDVSAARRRINEAECDAQYNRDKLTCNLVHTPLCWESAMERYAACLSGHQIPVLRF
jgi:hypothetical protein